MPIWRSGCHRLFRKLRLLLCRAWVKAVRQRPPGRVEAAASENSVTERYLTSLIHCPRITATAEASEARGLLTDDISVTQHLLNLALLASSQCHATFSFTFTFTFSPHHILPSERSPKPLVNLRPTATSSALTGSCFCGACAYEVTNVSEGSQAGIICHCKVSVNLKTLRISPLFTRAFHSSDLPEAPHLPVV
jgi:hypothetical protein